MMSPKASSRSFAARVMAATLGAGLATSLVVTALSMLLVRVGMDALEAVYATLIASFALFGVVSLAAFHARDIVRSWAWLVAASLGSGLAIWIAGTR